jgi:hypothetical protein
MALAPAPARSQPLLVAVASAVDARELKATITRLVGFGTRHTLSDTASETRGVGAARRWARGRFETLSAVCSGCLQIETPEQTFTGERIPRPTVVQDVIAVQTGVSEPQRVVIISAHIDSRNSDPLDARGDAPGANDDGSGTAAVLEAARVLSRHRFPATIVYAVLSGEEQGLYGGKILADLAKTKGWRVEAVLNNDIIGNTLGQDGQVDAARVRVFSEGAKASETPAEAAARRRNGGELDSPSRNLSRYLEAVAAPYVRDLRVRPILRADRYGRGGDQLPMQEAGFPAVRITEGAENYARQHQNVRAEGGVAYGDVIAGVDFAYLAKVTRLNVVALAALASAPASPSGVRIAGAVSPDTTLSWAPSADAAQYRVYWRETTSPIWTESRSAGPATSLTLPGVNIDDYFFGVSAVGPDGFESPIVFPGPQGAVFPDRPQ